MQELIITPILGGRTAEPWQFFTSATEFSIAGLVFGEEAARGQMAQELSALAGARAGEAYYAIFRLRPCAHEREKRAARLEKTTGVLATIIGLLVLLFGATTVFAELKNG